MPAHPRQNWLGANSFIEASSIYLDRTCEGISAQSLLLIGLRGVGKTMPFNHLYNDSAAKGFATVLLEAPEKRSLLSLLVPALRSAC